MREKMTIQEEKIYELNQIVKMREGKLSSIYFYEMKILN